MKEPIITELDEQTGEWEIVSDHDDDSSTLDELIDVIGDGVRKMSSSDQKKTADDDPRERAELIASLFQHIYGDDAASVLEELLGDDVVTMAAGTWKESDHPRGKGGRFIAKGGSEAYDSAKEKIDKALSSPRSEFSGRELMSHMNLLTVKQLRQLSKEYDIQLGGGLKSTLIDRLARRLDRGRRTESVEPKAGETAVETSTSEHATTESVTAAIHPEAAKKMTVLDDDTPVVKRHMESFGKMPAEHQIAIAEVVSGIYVADKPVTEQDKLGYLRGLTPRGWPPGSTWDSVAGIGPGVRGGVMVFGEGRHGTMNLAWHESAHALDVALGTHAIGSDTTLSAELTGPWNRVPKLVSEFAAVRKVTEELAGPYANFPEEAFALGYELWLWHKTGGKRRGYYDYTRGITDDELTILNDFYDNLPIKV